MSIDREFPQQGERKNLLQLLRGDCLLKLLPLQLLHRGIDSGIGYESRQEAVSYRHVKKACSPLTKVWMENITWAIVNISRTALLSFDILVVCYSSA